mgnify:CR=1 FL=1
MLKLLSDMVLSIVIMQMDKQMPARPGIAGTGFEIIAQDLSDTALLPEKRQEYTTQGRSYPAGAICP